MLYAKATGAAAAGQHAGEGISPVLAICMFCTLIALGTLAAYEMGNFAAVSVGAAATLGWFLRQGVRR